MSYNPLLGSRIAGGNTAYKRNASDYYPTPPEVTRALLDFLGLPKDTVIWEPACGEGHMVNEMERLGYSVYGTDIVQGVDFLTTDLSVNAYDWIITNPPFSKAEEFIRRSWETQKPFALLLKSQFWHAKRRLRLFQECRPQCICPLTWRPDFLFGQRGSGSPLMDVIWCIWLPGTRGVTVYYPLEKPCGTTERRCEDGNT